MKQNKRADYIDAVKGVAILCIVFLHFEKGVIPQWLNIWIGLFMITTFYFTSGWVTALKNKKTSTKELIRKRIKQLGVPYLWFSLLIILFDAIWCTAGFMENNILLRDIYKAVTLRGIGTLWFLPALLIGEILFNYIKNNNKWWLCAIVGMLATLATSYLYYIHWLPLRGTSNIYKIIDSPMQPLVRGLTAWPIIATGYLTAKYLWKKLTSAGNLLLFLTGCAVIALSVMLVVQPPFKVYYLNNFLSNSLPALGFMCLFAIMPQNKVKKFFVFWGINSLVLMCTHFSILQEILKTFNKEVMHRPFEGWITIIYFIAVILLTYPLVRLFNGKLKFMTGKK